MNFMRELMQIVERAAPAIAWTIPKGRARSIDNGNAQVVWVDIAKLDASFKRDPLYVGPGGQDGIGRRYAAFGEWLDQAQVPVEMPEVGIGGWGISFGNGRHRYSWMRDHGAKALPVVVYTEDAEEIERQFGTPLRQTILTTP